MSHIGPAESPTLVIQEALFAAASADVELTTTLGASVFDYIPEDAPRPYVVVGDGETRPDNTHSGFGWQTIAELSIWVEQRGFREAHLIKNRLIGMFDHQPLDVAPFHHVVTKFRRDRMLRDPNPKLRRAVLELEIQTEQER